MALMFEVKDGITQIVYNVRVVFENDRYGLNDCLVNEGAPLVEFYDSRHNLGDRTQNGRGQFASRYYVSTILKSQNEGLCLHGGVRDWQLCGRTFREVKQKLTDIASVFNGV